MLSYNQKGYLLSKSEADCVNDVVTHFGYSVSGLIEHLKQ